MARLAAELVDEFTHNYPRGRRTLGLDALPGDDVSRLALVLGDEFEARGIAVSRVAIPDASTADAFRALVLPTFRTDAELPADAVLIAFGTGLHAPGIVDVWNLSIWAGSEQDPDPADPQLRRYLIDVDPPRRADVILDIADAERPARRFADWCAVPRRRG